jgi:hypothetical protein
LLCVHSLNCPPLQNISQPINLCQKSTDRFQIKSNHLPQLTITEIAVLLCDSSR